MYYSCFRNGFLSINTIVAISENVQAAAHEQPHAPTLSPPTVGPLPPRASPPQPGGPRTRADRRRLARWGAQAAWFSREEQPRSGTGVGAWRPRAARQQRHLGVPGGDLSQRW